MIGITLCVCLLKHQRQVHGNKVSKPASTDTTIRYAHLTELSEIERKDRLSTTGGADVADIMDDTDDYGKPTASIDPSPQPTSTTTQKTNPPPVAEEASPGRSAIARRNHGYVVDVFFKTICRVPPAA